MTAQSPSAYFVSACLHAAVVAVLLLLVAINGKRIEEAPAIFELVAGVGNNYAAREAPALGEPGAAGEEPAVKLPAPLPVRPPDPAPAPPAVEETTVVPPAAPIERVPAPPAKAATPPSPNFVRDIKRLSEKRAANIEKKHKADQKAAAERARKEAELQAKRMSKEEFDRLNSKQKSLASGKTAGVKVPLVSEGIRGGVAGGSTSNTTGGAGGRALERGEMDLTDAYLALILQRIRQTMEQANFSDQLSVRLQFSVTPGGSINGVAILESSGSNEFDRAVLEAFRTIPDLGPPPNRKGGTFLVNLKMSDRS